MQTGKGCWGEEGEMGGTAGQISCREICHNLKSYTNHIHWGNIGYGKGNYHQ